MYSPLSCCDCWHVDILVVYDHHLLITWLTVSLIVWWTALWLWNHWVLTLTPALLSPTIMCLLSLYFCYFCSQKRSCIFWALCCPWGELKFDFRKGLWVVFEKKSKNEWKCCSLDVETVKLGLKHGSKSLYWSNVSYPLHGHIANLSFFLCNFIIWLL